jgi:class 3 adenylate cyclase/tetratricopeptide (TPR) repeat protein
VKVNVMRCANCGTDLIPGKRFCHACGTRVPLACPSCGAPVEAGFAFCPECGAALAVIDAPDRREERAPPGRAAGSERKLVTVLFCDLVGSTALAEKLDPEVYRELLDEYFALALAEINRLDGFTTQLAGDGVMALFGAPIAHEDAPQRAIGAALGIRSELHTLNERLRGERRGELHVRIGIHTGPVVVGTVGDGRTMSYTAIGDTTNLAARLQAAAAPDAILISEATQRLVRGFFELRAVGTFAVKGKSEPVVAYEVLGLQEAVTPMSVAEARGLTPFVGRRREMTALRACLERLRGGEAQLAAISGETGSGKSRLVYEFRQQLAGTDVLVFEARCAALMQNVPYAPFVAMLRQFFGISTREEPQCACDRLAARLREIDPTLEPDFPHLCRFMALPSEGLGERSGEELKRETFHAVAHVIDAASVRQPVVMILEDLHWIDPASLELLELGIGMLRGARIMMVVTHRPDFEPHWQTQAAVTVLRLTRFERGDATQILRALAGGALPAELEDRVLAKAEGSPFFLEEITRALIEEGYVVRHNEHLELTRPVAEIRIPDTIHEVIAARLDRLPPAVKRVGQVAAVLGRQFRRDHVAALLEGEGVDTARALEELERRGLVHRKTTRATDDFRFGESLTQEVAYEGLLLRERRLLHERIARLLEASDEAESSEGAALIAHHLARSDNREQALPALLRAARAAERVPSYPSAIRFYREAWALADERLGGGPFDPADPVAQAALDAAQNYCRLTVFYGASEDRRCEEAAQNGRAIAEAFGDTQSVAGFDAFHGLIVMAGTRERFPEGIALLERGLTTAQRHGHRLTALNISRGLALGYLDDGRFELAQRMFDWVVEELTRSQEAVHLSEIYLGAYMNQQLARYTADDLANALTGGRIVYELAVQAGNRTIQAAVSGTLGLVHFLRGEDEEAKRWADQGLPIAEAIGNVASVRTLGAVALGARLSLGESPDVARFVGAIEQGYAAHSDMALKCYTVVDVLLSAGERDRAARFAELAYAHAGGRYREALCAAALGEVARRGDHGAPAAAERWYATAAELAQAIGSRSVLALARTGQGELALAAGDAAVARTFLSEAARLCGEIGLGRYGRRVAPLLAAAGAPVAAASVAVRV